MDGEPGEVCRAGMGWAFARFFLRDLNGEGSLCANAHLSDDEAVAKMGHPGYREGNRRSFDSLRSLRMTLLVGAIFSHVSEARRGSHGLWAWLIPPMAKSEPWVGHPTKNDKMLVTDEVAGCVIR